MRMDDLEFRSTYRKAMHKCGWGELKLLLRLKEEENAREVSILKQLIKERRKNETT